MISSLRLECTKYGDGEKMTRYYKGKRIGADVYTIGKFGKGLRETLDTENPLLYSDGRYPTKLSAEDLP